MTNGNTEKPAEQSFWGQVFSANPQTIVTADNFDKAMPRPEKLGEGGDFWLTRLFQGEGFYGNPSDKMTILKNGVEVHEVPIEQLNQDTVIGRHPEAHIQLEAYKLGLFHIVLRKKDDRLYVEAIDEDYGTLLNRKKIKAGQPVLLRDGSLVDIPGYRLRFCLAGASLTEEEEALDAEELAEIPSYFYNPPPPPASPLLTNLVEDREKIEMWSEGVTTVKVRTSSRKPTTSRPFDWSARNLCCSPIGPASSSPSS
jgi:glycine betaine catabolism B